MGLNLQRESFVHWIDDHVACEDRDDFLQSLRDHIGIEFRYESWDVYDEEYPRVGSYTAFGIFRLFIHYLSTEDPIDLEEDEDVELEALDVFSKQWKRGLLPTEHISHLLQVGDSDTIFIPILFQSPFEFRSSFVASKMAVVKVLESLGKVAGFDLYSDFEEEYVGLSWNPTATARNIARILYRFFTDKPNACVAFT